MKIILTCLGKTNADYLKVGLQEYEKRLKRYHPFELQILPDLKKTRNRSPKEIKKMEAEQLMPIVSTPGISILLDENGKNYSSVAFSQFIQKQLNHSQKSIQFIIGGPYGFDEKIYQKVPQKLSISPMTFSHQMIRLLFVEQLYRAFTILNNEPYHHI